MEPHLPEPPEPHDPWAPVSSAGSDSPPVPRRRPAEITAPVPFGPDPFAPTAARPGARAQSRRRRRRTRWALAALAASVAIAGAGLWAQGASTSTPVAVGHRSAPVTPVRKQELSAAAIANQDDAAIVDVTTTLGYQNGQAAGTGIVLTSNGVVLTNHHVVQGSTSVSVKLSNSSRTYPATVVGIDATDDIAVLQAQGASGLSTAPLGNSSAVTVGQPVVAIGNALNKPGLPTVTEGAVTGLGRSISVSGDNGTVERLQNLIETSAPLQPGNSGGPLLDTAGAVIGINTAASSGNIPETGTSDGYAIPISDALSIAHQIESGHSTDTVHIGTSAFLGIQVRGASPGTNPGGGFAPGGGGSGGTSGSGVLVAGVEPGTPAASAGISTGDQIISVDGTSVSSAADVTAALSAKHPGDSVSVTWVGQDGGEHQATVRLASGPTA